MNVHVSRWVLELLLCCPEVGVLLKLVALRSIRSEIDEVSMSEKLLDFIEVVEVIDRNAGLRVTELMKEAYCAVAGECSQVHPQWETGEARKVCGGCKSYLDREDTGNGEIGQRTELVTPELLEWDRLMEVAVGDRSECLILMGVNSRADAFRAVRVYLTDALDKMRPSFLEAIAVRLGLGVHCSTRELSRMHDDGTESAWQAGAWVSHGEESTPSAPAKCTETNVTEDPRTAREPSETHESLGSKRLPCYKRKRDGSMIRDIEESQSETLWAEYDTVSSPDVDDAPKVVLPS